MRAAAARSPAAGTLQGLVAHSIATLGIEGIRTSDHARGAKADGAKSLLWLNRASTFMTRLMRGLADGAEPKAAAGSAYSEVLRPYPGFVTSRVVGTAMGLCPPMKSILSKLELPDEGEAQVQLSSFLALMEPLTAEVMELMVSSGINFPDKV